MRFVLLRGPRNRNSIAVLHRVLRKAVQGGEDRPVQGGEDRADVTVEVAAEPPPDLTAADVLAYSFTTIDLDTVIAELKTVREQNPRPLLIAGGAHPSADPEGCLRLGFDVVFVGEAELTLPAFLAAWSQDPRRSALPAGGIVVPDAPYDLDAEPHADADTDEFPFLEISRGCPHACAFCQTPQLFGQRMRFRSPATAAAGVACAVARGHRRIRCLTTDAFSYGGGPPEKVARSLDALTGACRSAGADYLMLGSFPSEVRPERVAPELLEVLARRCANPTVVVGVQSGSDAVLAAMRRGHTVEHSARAVRFIQEAGLVPHVDLLFGFPGETPADRRASLSFADWVLSYPRGRLHLHVYLPLPGTPAWPAVPEALEPAFVSRLRDLMATGRVDGYWDHHIVQGRRILAQARSGLIARE
ncbi:TIGR04013 family B12-binding domain/radical SAM domain-containing protein [Myxococcota bacterium]|nr:TIGR04013 family B12-binding domain/radical SAM domain-containing protein [Myxococcota bacterium]